MIPFGMARFAFADGEGNIRSDAVRILDLSVLGFTFRLRGECPPFPCAVLTLYSLSRQEYTDVPLSGFTVEEEEKTLFYTVYRLELAEKNTEIFAFQEEFSLFTQLKSAGEEEEITRIFCPDGPRRECKEMNGFSVSPDAQFALALEAVDTRKAFLDCEWADFLAFFRNRFSYPSLFGPAAGKIGSLYLGNEYCVSLMPGGDELSRMICKTRALGLLPVTVLPPLGERALDSALGILREVCIPDTKNGPCAVVVNDIGTAAALGELLPDGMKMILGTLMNKSKKDTRMHFLRAEPEKECAFGIPAAGRYLKALGAAVLSYDTDGRDCIPARGFSAEAHVPFYRMNTALVCPLRSVYEGRGAEGCCPGYCAELAFVYASESGCRSRFNSLFGTACGGDLTWADRVILHI